MSTDDYGKISPIFMTWNRKWYFEKVDRIYLLYGEDGEPVKEFRNFWEMCKYISKNGGDR